MDSNSLINKSPGGLTTVIKTVTDNNSTLVKFTDVYANTSGGAFTMNLPASPTVGDHIVIHDANNTFATYNLTISRNGNLINGVADNLECDINGAIINLRFKGSTIGWECVVESISGLVTASNQNSGWIDYTPVLTATTTNPTIGNGTIKGRYKYLDAKTIVININFNYGSTSNAGSGAWSLSLPQGLVSSSYISQILCGALLDASSDWKLLNARVAGSDTKICEMYPDGGNTLTSTTITWAVDDALWLSGILEIQ